MIMLKNHNVFKKIFLKVFERIPNNFVLKMDLDDLTGDINCS